MIQRLQTPLLLPTIGYITGCVVFGVLSTNIITPLITLAIGGVLFWLRGYSVGLLIIAIAIGGVRISLYEGAQWGDDDTLLSRANSLAQNRVSELQLSPRADGLVRAMVLSETSGISTTQRQSYGISGACHILAVSGLHLSIIFMLLNFALRPLVALPRGHIIKSLSIIAFIWIYGATVGLSPSLLRSAVMFTVFQVALSYGQLYGGVNALLFTLLMVVGVNPQMIWSVGFQLSAVAVTSIFLWGLPLYYRVFGGRGLLVSTLCIGFGCSVAVMPIVSHTFGYVPLLGVVFSPLFILCAVVIVSCGVMWVLLPIAFFGSAVRLLIEMAAMILDNSVRWIASKGWGVVEWRASEVEVILIYLIYIVITALIWMKKDE